MSGPEARFCRVCCIHLGTDASRSNENLCNSFICRSYDSIEAHNIKVRKQQERREALIEITQKRASDLSQEASLSIVVLPYLAHRLSSPTIERRRRVEERLLELATTATALNLESTPNFKPVSAALDSEEEESFGAPETNLLDKRFEKLAGIACGTCGGRCCNLGGDRAFLNTDKFREVLRVRPEVGPEDIVAEYMAQVPEETFQDSCIFHGLQGCGLTREHRSNTCNEWICPGLEDLKDSIDHHSTQFLMAATNSWDVDHPKPEIYRIKLVGDNSQSTLLADMSDR